MVLVGLFSSPNVSSAFSSPEIILTKSFVWLEILSWEPLDLPMAKSLLHYKSFAVIISNWIEVVKKFFHWKSITWSKKAFVTGWCQFHMNEKDLDRFPRWIKCFTMPLIVVESLTEPVWESLMSVFVKFGVYAHWRRKQCLVSLSSRQWITHEYDAYEGWPRIQNEGYRRELSAICLIMFR